MSEGSYLEIKLKRLDRLYRPGEKVEGLLIVNAYKGWSHNGIQMVVEGLIYLSHANRGLVGINSDLASRPIHILRHDIIIAPPGKCNDGITEYNFEFLVAPLSGQTLYESYHGVYVSIVYNMQAVCERGVMKKTLSRDSEFLIEIPQKVTVNDPAPISFNITPASLENVGSKVISTIPKFSVSGKLHRSKCPINLPVTGEVIIELAAAPVKSLELQLVRNETVSAEGKVTKEATEVQNIQIGDGDVCRNFSVPLYMVFPRLFSCPTLITSTFQIEWEVNLIIIYGEGYMITENFPIVLYRDIDVN
jgi:hypothetical protein